MSYKRSVMCDQCYGTAPIPEEGGSVPATWWTVYEPATRNPRAVVEPRHFCDVECLADYADRLTSRDRLPAEPEPEAA